MQIERLPTPPSDIPIDQLFQDFPEDGKALAAHVKDISGSPLTIFAEMILQAGREGILKLEGNETIFPKDKEVVFTSSEEIQLAVNKDGSQDEVKLFKKSHAAIVWSVWLYSLQEAIENGGKINLVKAAGHYNRAIAGTHIPPWELSEAMNKTDSLSSLTEHTIREKAKEDPTLVSLRFNMPTALNDLKNRKLFYVGDWEDLIKAYAKRMSATLAIREQQVLKMFATAVPNEGEVMGLLDDELRLRWGEDDPVDVFWSCLQTQNDIAIISKELSQKRSEGILRVFAEKMVRRGMLSMQLLKPRYFSDRMLAATPEKSQYTYQELHELIQATDTETAKRDADRFARAQAMIVGGLMIQAVMRGIGDGRYVDLLLLSQNYNQAIADVPLERWHPNLEVVELFADGEDAWEIAKEDPTLSSLVRRLLDIVPQIIKESAEENVTEYILQKYGEVMEQILKNINSAEAYRRRLQTLSR